MILLVLYYYDPILIFFYVLLHPAVNPKEIKTLLSNGLITFFINGNLAFSNGPRNLPKNPPACIILDNWVFDNLISADKSFAKALRRLEICLLVNNNLWGKLV